MVQADGCGRRMHDRAFRAERRQLADGLCRRHASTRCGRCVRWCRATHVDYVSAFGDDPFSEAQIAFFRAHGIGIARQPGDRRRAARPLCDHAHRRRAVLHLLALGCGGAAARRRPARLAKSLEDRVLVYFSGITLGNSAEPAAAWRSSRPSARRARRAAHIAFDPNYRPRLWADRRSLPAPRSPRRWPSPTSRCRPSPTNRRSTATPARRRRRGGWSAPASAEIVVKNGEADALVCALPAGAAGAGDAGRSAGGHDRRRRCVQRRLSRRAPDGAGAGRGGARAPTGSPPPWSRCAARWRPSRRSEQAFDG